MTDNSLIHFAHANGFPADSYQLLFTNLRKDFDVFAIDKLAHNPQYPLVNNWPHQVTELIDFISTKNKKVIGVGHSFGGVVTYMAACERPDLFEKIILLDPPLLYGIVRWVFKFAKKNSLIDRLTPAKLTAVRKRTWSVNDDMLAYFKSKALFRRMKDECIIDYVNSATKIEGQKRVLSYRADIEAAIFRTIPDNLTTYYKQLKVPSVLMSAQQSSVGKPFFYKPFLKAHPQMSHEHFTHGTHMFPLEYPELLSARLKEIIRT